MRTLASDPVVGVAVPRSRRSGGRVPRTWCTSMLQLLDLVEETVLEDEREALEALCFLSAGSCELTDAVPGSSVLPVPAKQQHSKGSSVTAEAVDGLDRKTVAVTSRRYSGRLPSPASDVSSGGSQGAVLHSQQQLQLPETLPVPLDEIHPGAHPVDIEQQVPTSTQRKQQQQPSRQHQQSTAGKKRKQAATHQQPAPEAAQQQQRDHVDGHGAQLQLGSLDLAGSTCAAGHLEGLDSVPSTLASSGMPTEQYGMLGQAALDSTLLTADTMTPYQAAAVQHAATGFHPPPSPSQLGPLLQSGSQHLAAAAAAGLNPAQLAALAAAAAVGPSPLTAAVGPSPFTSFVQQPQGLSELLAQLLLSSGWRAPAAPLQSSMIAPQPMWPTHSEPACKRPPVKTGSWHVYIANMIAKGRQKKEEQQQQQQQQQRSDDAAEPPHVEAAAEAPPEGSPSKRQRTQQTPFEQQPAVHQAPAQTQQTPFDLAGILGGAGAVAPSLAQTLVAAAAAAAAAGQSSTAPGLSTVVQASPLPGLGLNGPAVRGALPGALPMACLGLAPEVLVQLLGAQHLQGQLGPGSVSLPGHESLASGNPAKLPLPGFAQRLPAGIMPGAALHHLHTGVQGAALQQLQALQLALPGLGLVAQ